MRLVIIAASLLLAQYAQAEKNTTVIYEALKTSDCSFKVINRPIVFKKGEYNAVVGKLFLNFNAVMSNLHVGNVRKLKVGRTFQISGYDSIDDRFLHIIHVEDNDITFVALNEKFNYKTSMPSIGLLKVNEIETLSNGNLKMECINR